MDLLFPIELDCFAIQLPFTGEGGFLPVKGFTYREIPGGEAKALFHEGALFFAHGLSLGGDEQRGSALGQELHPLLVFRPGNRRGQPYAIPVR